MGIYNTPHNLKTLGQLGPQLEGGIGPSPPHTLESRKKLCPRELG